MARMTARCMRCGSIHETKVMVATPMPDRGKHKVAYMCADCANKNMEYVSGHLTKVVGTPTKDGGKYGIEVETTSSTDYARNQFFNYMFIPTHDSSLNNEGETRYTCYGYHKEASCEYVSGLNNSLKSFTKQLLTIEKMLSNGDITMDDSCGTHFHVSINDMKDVHGNKTYMSYICNYFQSLFTELQCVMESNPEKTKRFFGRYFDYSYAPKFYSYTRMNVSEHRQRYCWVNCTNDNNVEFRINKFISASQYQELMKFEKWVVQTIINNFCSKYNETNERKVLAQKTGKKLARKLEKIYATL